jgi:hypothetical protein
MGYDDRFTAYWIPRVARRTGRGESASAVDGHDPSHFALVIVQLLLYAILHASGTVSWFPAGTCSGHADDGPDRNRHRGARRYGHLRWRLRDH